jgi:DUF1009 family protein
MQTQPDKKNHKVGLIAGNGDLPENIIAECIKSGREIFVILIGDNQPKSINKVPHISLSIGSVGKAINTLRKENIKNIVFAGGLKRPKFTAIRLDAGGIKLVAKITKAKFIGDNSLLSIILKFFEDAGFKIIGADDILQNILMPKGVIGKMEPNKTAIKDMETGIHIAKSIGALDIGQSVIIQDGVVIGVEAVEGTDALIKRCAKLQNGGKGGVLIKMKKPKQDKRIDLPTIGTTTIEHAHQSGLVGIAIEAGGALIIDQEKVAQKADELGLFVIGV